MVTRTNDTLVNKIWAEENIVEKEVQTTLDIVPWNIVYSPVFEPLSPKRETSPTSTNYKFREERMEGEGRVDNWEKSESNNEV